ncbi:MAG: DNA-directed RNA polymerase subunit A' [Candidatus Pacearchaeota archaeon]
MKEDKIIKKQIKSLSFHLISPEEIKKIAVVKIVTPELYDVDGYPVDGGLMDLKMGVIDPGLKCRTDGKGLHDCPGYFGYIELARPVIHIKYINIIDNLLKSCCSACGKVLLNEEEAKKIKNFKERLKKAKNTKKCPHCGFEKEDEIKFEKPSFFFQGKKRINNNEIMERLSKIDNASLKILGFNPEVFRPEWAILNYLLVPPVTVRPSITLETGERSEDDITHKLSDIIRTNQRLWENLNAGATEVIIEDLWDLLQYHVTTFFDNSIERIPPARHRSGQPLKTITERIKGKEGRIRKNLAGKRVNFSARTAISPDPNIKINEIGVPPDVAKIITVNEKVNRYNIERIKDLILSKERYPKIINIIRPDGKKKKVIDELREDLAKEIEIGYSIDRTLMDGDIVLFNRHPSLHRVSIMAHYVKILPGRTFRLHPAVCPPYNADFDGDEMNIHGPQTEEARAEAKYLLAVENSIMSPKNNTNLIGCNDDAILGNYILSRKKLTFVEAMQFFYNATKESLKIKKDIEGEELLKKIIPENVKLKSDFKNTKNLTSEEGEIIKELDCQLDRKEVLSLIEKIYKIGANFLSHKGFTISLHDLLVNEEIKKETRQIIEKANKKISEIIEQYQNGTLERLPSKTLEETREIKLLQVLNSVRSDVGKFVKEKFPKDNLANKMISSGARGNILNITQLSCLVGQQVLNGKRINFGYKDRSLSFYKKGDLSPRANGFIESSFIEGLRPDEFFFGAITGRDAMMDTALRTPKSGYLYRRLVSALQDLVVEYDNTIRDASENIVQFAFGGDGFDVSLLHKKEMITPGEAIGVVTSQSFGESSTQMVLNVFHSAGVAEMQVTQGLPRLIEILDARKEPSTPTMEIYLDSEHNNEKEAKKIAEKLKELRFEEIISEISIDFASKTLEVNLNTEAIKRVGLDIEKIKGVIKEKGINLKEKKDSISIITDEKTSFKDLYKLKERIKKIKISGIERIKQVLLVKRDKDYVILTFGSNLKEVLKIKGINKDKVFTNNLHEIAEVLGIEAARRAIIEEISKVLVSQGLYIDRRHLSLVADAMTYSGVVKGVTRIGIISDKSSILARACFETPDKHFINATKTGKKDVLSSVIENIMLNQTVPIGTGLPGLLVKVSGKLSKN